MFGAGVLPNKETRLNTPHFPVDVTTAASELPQPARVTGEVTGAGPPGPPLSQGPGARPVGPPPSSVLGLGLALRVAGAETPTAALSHRFLAGGYIMSFKSHYSPFRPWDPELEAEWRRLAQGRG